MDNEEVMDVELDKNDEHYDAMENKFLTFRLGDEEYGLEIRRVLEIIGIQPITEVPNMPRYIKGVINMRGKVVPLMDIRIRFNMRERIYDEKTCVIVVNYDNTQVGLVVDRVLEVMDILPGDIEPAVNRSKSDQRNMFMGMGKVGDSIKILVDLPRLLYNKDFSLVSAIEFGDLEDADK